MKALPATVPAPSKGWTSPALAALIFALALAVLRWDLDSEPRFVDEAAFLSQSYFWDLAVSGRWDDPLWLEYPAYDLPPLPKYLIGASLQAHGIPRPGRKWAMAWYRGTNEARFVNAANLHAARLPSVLMGAFGCAAIFAVGAIAAGRRVGLLAALLLMLNPLYRLHARRAMADVPAEALVLATLAAGLYLGKRCLAGRIGAGRLFGLATAVGLMGGLAVLAKLNGGLGLMTVWAWGGLALALSVRGGATFLGGIAISGVVALTAFIALNPFVTARPRSLGVVPLMAPVPAHQTMGERLAEVIRHRVDVSRAGQSRFAPDALTTPVAKVSALVVQGFGRFGPLGPSHSDSTRRFDWSQDRGAVLWLPCVLAGLVWAVGKGVRQRRSGEPPTAWALAAQLVVAVVTVGAFLPLAWDRYFLPIQASSALLASGAAVALFDAIRARAARA